MAGTSLNRDIIPPMPWEILQSSPWQMSGGERAAVEGVLATLRPALAVEIGSAEGGCLLRLACYSGEVHSFDLQAPLLDQPDNVTCHTGNSHELLPAFLAQLEGQERNVDLVIVDGDHSPEGVRQDLEDLLDSPALGRSVILIHDTANERVRAGVDAVAFSAWPKVSHVELDWIPGHLFAEPALRNELWYGLGLVTIDTSRVAYMNGSVFEQRYRPAAPLLAEIRDRVVARETSELANGAASAVHAPSVAKLGMELRAEKARSAELGTEIGLLRDRLRRSDATLQNITGSPSWKLTEPLRSVKHKARGLRRD
jgi:hypothetical protein